MFARAVMMRSLFGRRARYEVRIALALCCASVFSLAPSAVEGRSALVDSTDLKLRNSSSVDALGAENSIFIHPTDSRIILEAHNNHANGGVGAWVSQDGGKTWAGDNGAAGGAGPGDPAAVIRRPTGGEAVRYYVGRISSGPPDSLDLGQQVVYKESATSLAWTSEQVVDNTLGYTDKNHLWVDNNTTGTGAAFLYSAWSNVDTKRVEVMRKTANGAGWAQRQNVDPNSVRAEWGVNLKVGLSSSYRNHVYAVWGETVTHRAADRIEILYFNKSTNAGESWGAPTQVVSLLNVGYELQDLSLSGKSMGANSAPSMAVDGSGNIFVVWGQKRRDGTSSDGEIYLMKSTDEGATWSAPLRVNQDTGTADQWLPWVTWDDCTNAIVVAFFDSRLPTPPDPLHNTKADTYMAVSYDGGATFPSANEKRVSDVSWSGDCSPRGRAGDYIGVAARDGIAYPVWSDDRGAADAFKVYVSPIYLWGPVQSSISHTISSVPGLGLSVGVSWVTDLPATCDEGLLLTAPSGATQVFAGPCDICKINPSGITHQFTRGVTCEPGWWKYTVKNTRCGFTTRGSDERKFLASCID